MDLMELRRWITSIVSNTVTNCGGTPEPLTVDAATNMILLLCFPRCDSQQLTTYHHRDCGGVIVRDMSRMPDVVETPTMRSVAYYQMCSTCGERLPLNIDAHIT